VFALLPYYNEDAMSYLCVTNLSKRNDLERTLQAIWHGRRAQRGANRRSLSKAALAGER